MSLIYRFCLPALLTFLSLIFSGCISTEKYSEFQYTINFAQLDTYQIRDVVIDGFHMKESENADLEKWSHQALRQGMAARDFAEAQDTPDFVWVIHWNKSSTFNPGPLESINGLRTELNSRDDPSHHFATRWHLTLQAYLPGEEFPFWEKELPNIFDALELNEWRTVASIERGLTNFPQRVEKDPNLPSIE